MKTINYRHVDLAKVLAIPLYGNVMSNMYKAFFHQRSFDECGVHADICVIYSFRSLGRADYDEIIDNLLKILKSLSPVLVVVGSSKGLHDKIKLLNHFFASLPLINQIQGSSLRKLSTLLLIARAKVSIDSTISFLEYSDIKIVVTFCDAHDTDNIIAQCANNAGMTTITLQHGQYCIDQQDNPENMALSNICSDYFCAWNQATCDEFAKVSTGTSSAKAMGSLKSLLFGEALYCVEELAKAKNKNVICVMLNADNSVASNVEMLKVSVAYCESQSYQFCIRFHPNNVFDNYSEFLRSEHFVQYDQHTDDIAFTLAYTTGAIVEILKSGSLLFLYHDSEVPEIFKDIFFSFQGVGELEMLVQSIFEDPEKGISAFNNVRSRFVSCGSVHSNYLEYFKFLLKTEKIGDKKCH